MQSLEGFSKEVAKVWQSGVLGVNLGEIITALVVIFVFLFARRLFYRFVTSSLKSVTRKTKTDLDDFILEAIEKPLEFAFVVIGLYFAGQIISLPDTVSEIFDKIVRSLIAFTIFWALFRALTPLSTLFDRGIGLFGSEGMQETMKSFFVKLAKVLVFLLGLAAVFQEWGFNVAAVLGSLGLVGMAVALGAQDLIKNMFAGLTIFLGSCV